MRNRFQKVMKNQKGMTLVELLAVIVILAIVTAIAVPSIGGIINKSKNSAHISNALMVINAAKIGVASQDSTLIPTDATPKVITLDGLVAAGYLDVVPQDPSVKGKTYDKTTSTVTIKKDINGKYTYSVVLNPDEGTGTTDAYVNASESTLNKGDKTDPKNP